MVPLSDRNGAPEMLPGSPRWPCVRSVSMIRPATVWQTCRRPAFSGIGVLALLAVVTVLAVASLFLPFALRASRMMWVVTLSGGALAVASSRIVVAVDDDGPVAGSVLPGVVFALLGLLACVGLVSGMAVHRFSLLRQARHPAYLYRLGVHEEQVLASVHFHCNPLAYLLTQAGSLLPAIVELPA